MCVAASIGLHSNAGEVKDPSPKKDPPKIPDPYKDLYAAYTPPFLKMLPKKKGDGYGTVFHDWAKSDEEMKLSTEPSFFTLNVVEEADRANALVEAGLQKETEGQFREALKLYQTVIEKFPNELYRVSQYGVFVPVSQYCQRRILNFPKSELAFYRTLYDARAKEAFEQARRKNSLGGLAEVADTMLATSYGDKALLELGNAALDAGNFLEALEYFTTLRDFYHDSDCRTPELEIKIAYCEKVLNDKPRNNSSASNKSSAKSALTADELERLQKVAASAAPDTSKLHAQQASAPQISADDYMLFPPPEDPLALKNPVWTARLPGSRRDFFVYTQPVVAENNLLYRHKNILYCRSLLNGELRWSNDLGGRVVWQNWQERLYPEEDILVQDGMVFSPIYKVGPSLAALDGVTGQLRWAYGPLAASSDEESHMRFEAAPAGGNRGVFSGYILDNIEGDTHTDSEYGVMAFDSATGRVRWRAPLCRLAPGKFAGNFAEVRRNRIRSFSSPPLYHEGTLYYNTNAGALAALDSRSGRIKWLMRYPYFPEVHDATRQFGRLTVLHGGVEFVQPHDPMFWLNQRPLMVGEKLYIAPVDSPFLFCIDRRTGKILWDRPKPGPGFTYFLGPISTGELVIVSNGRGAGRRIFGSDSAPGGPVYLLNPDTGEIVWNSPDVILQDDQPVMKHYVYEQAPWFSINTRWFETAARPFLTSDDRLYLTSWTDASIYWRPGMHAYHLACLSLKDRTILQQRRYYTGELLAHAAFIINESAPKELKDLENLPAKDAKIDQHIAIDREIVADKVPENAYGPFMPFSRMTFNRYGVQFDLRMSARGIDMVYDRDAVRKTVEKRDDPESYFARAELAAGESRLDDTAELLNKCLATVSTEDLDFRALINQQLFQTYQRTARRAILRANPGEELQSCLGMTRTASTLAEEMETLFALADAYERKTDFAGASRCLRNVIAAYGHHEYPLSSLTVAEPAPVIAAAEAVMDRAQQNVNPIFYPREMNRSLALMKQGLPLYFSTVSPLPKTLTVRAGELAATRLIALQRRDPAFAKQFEELAARELAGAAAADEQLQKLLEFPGTAAAQKIVDTLFQTAGDVRDEASRQRVWLLCDAARLCGLNIPDAARAGVLASPRNERHPAIAAAAPREYASADAEGTARLVLKRRDEGVQHANLLFLGGRTRKRSDSKFVLTCLDLDSGKQLWETPELRLKGKGDEGGFFEAFVQGDLVVVHGLYDVLAFSVGDGKLAWRYLVPFDFEVKRAAQSGDVLILSGQSETLALYIPARSPAGELIWQEKEAGDIYLPPYFLGDRLISVRKLPFNVTARYRATGKLIGRLALPDLSLNEKHPLIENGPPELPAAHDGPLLIVTDNWYYIAVDVSRMAIVWKRSIDQSDAAREPAMRFYLKGDYFAALKENFDQKSLYMLSSKTGEVLWNTDPKNAKSPQPMYSILFDGDKTYGILPHPGQGFYLVGLESKTGKRLFTQETKGYAGKPLVELFPAIFETQCVAAIQDNQDFELRAFDLKNGKEIQKLGKKGVGPIGVHGRVSAEVQNGRLILLSKDQLSY